MNDQVRIEYLKAFVKESNHYLKYIQNEKVKMVNQVIGVSWKDSCFDNLCQALDKIRGDISAAQKLAIECKDFIKDKMTDFENS